MPSKIHMVQVNSREYRSPDWRIAKRELGYWVLRDKDGSWIDYDQYRHDLFERNGYIAIDASKE